MTTEEMRRRISAVYNGLSWKKKVANMPERQVYAIYMSFKKSGKFKIERELSALKNTKNVENMDLEAKKWHQMTFEEVFSAGNYKNNVIMEVNDL